MILITGSTGTLGVYLQDSLLKAGIAFEAPSSKDLDLSSLESIDAFFKDKKYSYIMHLAAVTDVDLCERDPSKAYLINGLATEALAMNAARIGAKIMYISTSAVFGAVAKLSFCELDTTRPVSFYGSSKLFGEEAIQRSGSQYLILRSSFMIGGGPDRDKKFIGKILPKLRSNEDVLAVSDKLGSLTYAKDLADFMVDSIKTNIRGIVHITSSDFCSRYDIAKHIKVVLDSKSKITPIPSQVMPLSAPRPMSEALTSCSPHKYGQKTCNEIIDEYMSEWK